MSTQPPNPSADPTHLDDAVLSQALAAGVAASAFAIDPSWRAGALAFLRDIADAAALVDGVAGVEEFEPAETFVP